jgi:hypothetical protein
MGNRVPNDASWVSSLHRDSTLLQPDDEPIDVRDDTIHHGSEANARVLRGAVVQTFIRFVHDADAAQLDVAAGINACADGRYVRASMHHAIQHTPHDPTIHRLTRHGDDSNPRGDTPGHQTASR